MFLGYAYGAVAEWFYSGMCGIKPNPESPGFEHFYLTPSPDMRKDEEIPTGQKRITTASAAFDSVSGRIESTWVAINGRYEYKFVIPKKCCATVALISDKNMLKINDIDFNLDDLNGKRINDRIVFSLEAGEYTVVII